MTQEEEPNHFQDNSRLWSIEDAKIGDILTASDKSIFIFAGLKCALAQSYIALLTDGYLNTMKCDWEEKTSVAPAAKEERDLLFQKMKEAGYQWDANKKELKKINEKDMTQSEDYKKGYRDALANIKNEIEQQIAETEKVFEPLLTAYNPIIGQRVASKQHSKRVGLAVALMIIEKALQK